MKKLSLRPHIGRHNNSSKQLAFILMVLTILGVCIGGCATKDVKQNLEVNEARELLDSWNGQTAILDQAHAKLEQIIKSDPQNYLALFQIARYQMDSGYTNSSTVRLNNHEFSVHHYLPGTIEQVEETIKHVHLINPLFSHAYVFQAHIQIDQIQLERAEEYLAKAESIEANTLDANLAWARLNIARGEYSKAHERLQFVLQSNRSDNLDRKWANTYLVNIYIQEGENEEAVALYKALVDADPNDAWLRGSFALYLSETLGRQSEAISQATEALKIMNYGAGRRILALAYYRKWAELVAQGNDVEAKINFQSALEIMPNLNEVMAYATSAPNGELLAKTLISHEGVSINSQADDGSTALLLATNQNRAEVVKILLNLKADPNIPDKAGWTPLLSAADEGNATIVDMLLGAGADIQARMQGYYDAVYMAERNEHTDVAAMLKKRRDALKPTSSPSRFHQTPSGVMPNAIKLVDAKKRLALADALRQKGIWFEKDADGTIWYEMKDSAVVFEMSHAISR